MKKTMTRRSFAGLTAVAGMSALLAGCSSGEEAPADNGDEPAGEDVEQSGEAVQLRFVTGGESGTYYAFGSVIAQHATNNTNVAVTALAGNGSQANIFELEDGNAELAFCQSDVMAYAYEGTNLFADTGAVSVFSTVGYLYDEQVQIVTCNPEIKTVGDLAGKNVSIGAAGSGVYFNAIDILGAYGLTESDINPTYESFADSANSLKDGKIDAAFIVAGAPTTAITELSTSKQAYLVSIEEAQLEALLQSSPYYVKAVIPAGTYTGVDTDTSTVAVGAVLLAADSVPAEAIQTLAADIFDNAANLTENHAKYGEVDLAKAAAVTSVPYHPGAAAYFESVGYPVIVKE